MWSIGPTEYIAAVAALVSAMAWLRSNKEGDRKNWDARIDERIDLRLGADMAVVKSDLQQIKDALVNNAHLVQNTVDATMNAIAQTAQMISVKQNRGD